MSKISKDIVDVCMDVLDTRAARRPGITINGSRFNLDETGMCQKNVRLVYEAATGEPMPYKDDCAGKTVSRLLAACRSGALDLPWYNASNWASAAPKLQPGDFVYFGGGTKHTCGFNRGHVGIWLGVYDGSEWMFQNTSRTVDGVPLGTTRRGPTDDQKSHFEAAFRFLPATGAAPSPATEQIWQFSPIKDASGDITCTGIATQFDDAVTRTHVPANRVGLLGCSLPRGFIAATKGSGFQGVPDFALVRVYAHKTKKTIWCTVIDEGPAWIAQAGTGRPGGAMIDLTPGAASALGLALGENATVSIRIFLGSEQVVSQGRAGMWVKA